MNAVKVRSSFCGQKLELKQIPDYYVAFGEIWGLIFDHISIYRNIRSSKMPVDFLEY